MPGKKPDICFGYSRSFYYSLAAAGVIRLIRTRKPGQIKASKVLISYQEVRAWIERCRNTGARKPTSRSGKKEVAS